VTRAALALAFAWAGCVLAGCADGAAEACVDAVDAERTRHVSIPARAYDVEVHARGYVLGTSRGVMRLDPCTFEVSLVCDDVDGVRELAITGELAEYTTLDGSLGACDLARALVSRPRAGAAARIASRRTSSGAGATSRIRAGRAELAPRGEKTRTLRTPGDPLGTALSPDGRELAVSDTRGTVTFFTVPGGLVRARWQALESNAYAVAYDRARHRVLSVGGPGSLSVRRR